MRHLSRLERIERRSLGHVNVVHAAGLHCCELSRPIRGIRSAIVLPVGNSGDVVKPVKGAELALQAGEGDGDLFGRAEIDKFVPTFFKLHGCGTAQTQGAW